MLHPSRRVLSIAGASLGAALLATAITLVATRHADEPAETASTSSPSEPGPPEQPALSDDFALVDLDAAPSAGLEGVVTTLSDLPIAPTKRTMRYLDHLANDDKGRKTFAERYRRAGRYEEHIESKLQDADMPEDLVWVAAIESSMSPQATSPAGAAGLFQFMPETADRFGLFVGNELDERRSVTKSTDAAIAYLGVLFDTFGAWDLALAAYNCGEGRLEQALTDARASLGRNEEEPVTFPELCALGLLPKETADYVPKIHAFAIAVHNREILHLDDVEPIAAMHFSEIAVPGGTKIAPIAKAAGISVATLREYNPDLLSDRLPPGLGDMLVEVPPDRLEQTLAALPALLER
ncbi:MAG TPA: transglycosylase SLT domain-containing protein, partial [Polyangiaceae bacterium]|nr:transglycosylase SLT domain-containing protein [Polyangiaceae bacterium]